MLKPQQAWRWVPTQNFTYPCSPLCYSRVFFCKTTSWVPCFHKIRTDWPWESNSLGIKISGKTSVLVLDTAWGGVSSLALPAPLLHLPLLFLPLTPASLTSTHQQTHAIQATGPFSLPLSVLLSVLPVLASSVYHCACCYWLKAACSRTLLLLAPNCTQQRHSKHLQRMQTNTDQHLFKQNLEWTIASCEGHGHIGDHLTSFH